MGEVEELLSSKVIDGQLSCPQGRKPGFPMSAFARRSLI